MKTVVLNFFFTVLIKEMLPNYCMFKKNGYMNNIFIYRRVGSSPIYPLIGWFDYT